MARLRGFVVMVQFLYVAAVAAQPDSAYVMEDGLAVIEAENLSYSNVWSLETAQPGYTGSGYLKYTGPSLDCLNDPAHDNDPFPYDDDGSCLNAYPEDHLRIPVNIDEAGVYYIQIHHYHFKNSAPDMARYTYFTDASIWTHVEGYELPMNYSHSDVPCCKWEWLEYGPRYPGYRFVGYSGFKLDPGVHTFLVIGRVAGFCVDRITIYRMTGRNLFPANIMSTSAPLSVLAPVENGTPVVPRSSANLNRVGEKTRIQAFGGNISFGVLHPGETLVHVNLSGASSPLDLAAGELSIPLSTLGSGVHVLAIMAGGQVVERHLFTVSGR